MNASRQSVELLMAAMEEGWTTLRCRLEGLTAEEFFWEPVPSVGRYIATKPVTGSKTMPIPRRNRHPSRPWPGE